MNPLDSESWPADPSMPSSAPYGYVTPNLPGLPQARPLVSAQEIAAQRKRFYELLIRELVRALTGFFNPNSGSAFDQLRNWALTNGGQALRDALTGIVNSTPTDLDNWLLSLVTSNSPLDAAKLIGQIGQHLLTRIGIGALVQEPTNVFPDGSFPQGSIPPNGIWTIDTAASRTTDGTGAAKVIFNGTSKLIGTGQNKREFIAVTANQKINVKTYMRHENFNAVGSDVVSLILVPRHTDGTVGEPVVLDTYTPSTPNVDWPGHELGGQYTVPEGVDGVQGRISISSGALSGTGYFDDFTGQLVSQIQMSWVEGLIGEIDEARDRWQALIDTIRNTVGHIFEFGANLEQLAEALTQISFLNILGIGGPGNIGGTVQAIIDAAVGGAVGLLGNGASLPDLFNMIFQVSSNSALGAFVWDLFNFRNNEPVDGGLMPNEIGNISMPQINQLFPVTQDASIAATFRMKRSSPLGVVSWLGYGTDEMTAFYVNVWKDAGDHWELVHSSPNILAEITPGISPQWQFYFLDDPVSREMGEVFAHELVPVGGTHYVLGHQLAAAIPNHPFSSVEGLGFKRDNTTDPDDPPSTVSKSNVTYSSEIPYITTAVDTGDQEIDHEPVVLYFNETTTIPRPRWAHYVDVIPVGAGGAGSPSILGLFGEPGRKGSVNPTTWIYTIHFDDSVTTISFTRGNGGTPGLVSGGSGGSTTFSIPGHTQTASGGAGGDTPQLLPSPGVGPGEIQYNTRSFVAGGNQEVPGSSGVAPGGPGTGGSLLRPGGGPGAPGGGWIVLRQHALPGEPEVGDPVDPAMGIQHEGIASRRATGDTTVFEDGLLDPALAEQVEQIMIASRAATGVPGMVLVLRGPAGYFEKAIGFRAKNSSAPMTVGTHFRGGSTTKHFVACAILRAYDAGLLDLNDTIDQYATSTYPLNEIPNSNKVTIRNLMQMRSGLYDPHKDLLTIISIALFPSQNYTMKQAFNTIKSGAIQAEPDTVFDYNNGNYFILGMILEAVYPGRTCRQIITEDFLVPLGMTESEWPTTTALREPYARGYGGLLFDDVTSLNPGFLGPAGALAFTSPDLQKWGHAVMHNEVGLEPETWELWHTAMVEYPNGATWSLGPPTFRYGLGQINVGSFYGHDGSQPGYGTVMCYSPEYGAVATGFENTQTPNLAVLTQVFVAAMNLIYPGSMKPVAKDIEPEGIEPRRAFGKTKMFVYHEPGDEDGNTGIPIKIPFYL